MKLPRRNFLHLAACAAALPAVPRIAFAQAYPSRPVRLIVPIAPAGASDITARLIGQWLSERLGQQFVIDNRPGGGNNIGTEAVVRASPDGEVVLQGPRVVAIIGQLEPAGMAKHVGVDREWHLGGLPPVAGQAGGNRWG